MSLKKNAFYAQSGGVTAVINASACGVIETARKHKDQIGKVYAGRNGIIGALTEDMIDTGRETAKAIAGLRHTPGGAFGSARYKLKGLEENRAEYERLIEVFKAHNIGYFFYNGGGDSADTCSQGIAAVEKDSVSRYMPFSVPKTVDNDLPITDTCPGFGSVAKYIAVSTRKPLWTLLPWRAHPPRYSYSKSWADMQAGSRRLAALRARTPRDAPHIILFPEVAFKKRCLPEDALRNASATTNIALWSSAKVRPIKTAHSWPMPAPRMLSAINSWAASPRSSPDGSG